MENNEISYETLTPLAADESPAPLPPASSSPEIEPYVVLRNHISLSTIQFPSPESIAPDYFSLDVNDAADKLTSLLLRAREMLVSAEPALFELSHALYWYFLLLKILDFCEFLSPTAEEQESRNAAIKSVFDVINYIWPNAVAEVFGSFETGLYLPSSDIDDSIVTFILIALFSSCKLWYQAIRIYKPESALIVIVILTSPEPMKGWEIDYVYTEPNVVPSLSLVCSYDKNIVLWVVILGSNVRTPLIGLQALSRALSQRGIAKKMQVIAKARIPIIKFVEKKSGFSFDISLHHINIFDVHNGSKAAEFIKVYTGGIGSYALLSMLIAMLRTHRDSQTSPECNLGVLLVNFFDLYGCKLNTADVGISCNGECIFFEKYSNGFSVVGRPSLIAIEDPQARSAFAMAFTTLTNARTIQHLGPNRSILSAIIRPDAVLLERKGGSNGKLTFNNLFPGNGEPLEQLNGDDRQEIYCNWALNDEEEEESLPRGARLHSIGREFCYICSEMPISDPPSSSSSSSGSTKSWIIHGVAAGAAAALAVGAHYLYYRRSGKFRSRVVGIIPARYASSRFQGKPLVNILGKPMIQVFVSNQIYNLIDN
ncbi:hypothetical protein SASPL_144330 [Salvia splendens]|uniref:Uncharacterized protein n=1 Tax=Salvia splendens TaxID=180675 RepID=A0A8X8Z6P1_SALSN|nr:hypothetical protein SASPL_144330 [Salvia splendens]